MQLPLFPQHTHQLGQSVLRNFCGGGWEREGLASLRCHSMMEMEGTVAQTHHSASVRGRTVFCSAGAHAESNIKVEKLFVVQILWKPEVLTLILPLMTLDKVNDLPRTLMSHLWKKGLLKNAVWKFTGQLCKYISLGSNAVLIFLMW